jgi:hypothetical protein
MSEKPSYYSITPATVRYDKDLCPNAKLLYGEITCLADKTGECWASNGYFASLYRVNPNTIRAWVGQLAAKGYVFVETRSVPREGKTTRRRFIRISDSGLSEKLVTRKSW